jgi:membrane associated rhomboid family serine protease
MDVKENSYKKRMNLGQDGNALIKLLIVNAVVFVILKFIFVVYLLSELNKAAYYTNIYNWFVVPASLDKLAYRPWTLVSYMFSDSQLFRFVSNMFWLWSFGYIMQDLTGNKKLVPVYLYGGLTGAFLFVAAHYALSAFHPQPGDGVMAGANCAIVAVAVATTAVSADYRIFPMINGGIPLWVLTIAFLLINFSSIGSGDPGAYVANTGAAGFGFLFIYEMRRGRDWSAWLNDFFDWVNNLFNPDKQKKQAAKKDEFFYNVSGTQPYKRIPNITQKRIDEILDKINQQGYRFLTNEEKEILKRAAEEEDL